MSEDPRIALINRAFEDFEARDVEVDRIPPSRGPLPGAPPLMNVGEWHGYPGFVQMTAGWEEAFGVISYELREIELPDERSA